MWAKLVKNNKLLAITLFSLIIIGFVILTNLLSFSNIENVIIDQIKTNQFTETTHAASEIENHIIQVKDELVTLSKFPLMDTLDINKCTGDMKIIHEKIEGKIDSLLRADRNGNIIECSSPDFSNYLNINIQNKDYFKVPKETNEPYISGIQRQGTSQQIIISVPLFETTKYTPYPNFVGEFKGILMSIVEVDKLYNLYIHSALDNDKVSFILVSLDTNETILKSDGMKEYSMIKYQLSTKNRNLNTIMEFDTFGKTIVTSSDLILGTESWRLITFAPLDLVGKEMRSIQIRHLFSLIFVIIVIITAFFFLIKIYKSKEEVEFKLEKANVTLEKLGINIETEKERYTQSDINLESKKIYLIQEDDENHAHELFIGCLNKGFAGLGIVRENPNTIKKKYNLQKTSFMWLTKTSIEGIASETNINNLYKLISEFVNSSKKSVVLIDRLDYIFSENKPENVVEKIRQLKDLTQTHDSIIILSINPDLVNTSELKAIEAESVDLYGKHLRKNVDLSQLETNILNFVNEKNINNQLASYRDITNNFKITKPTTRVKIANLQKQGLLIVEQKGRFKSIKITSSGRKIIK